MASKDLEVNEQGTAGKGKCVTLTVPQELGIIGGLEGSKYQNCCRAFMHHQINSLWYKEMEGPITVIYDIKLKYQGPSQETDIETA